MRASLLCAAALVASLGPGSVAWAQDDEPDATYDFEDEDVGGGYQSSLRGLVCTLSRGRNFTLVRPRLHFVPELTQSVESL